MGEAKFTHGPWSAQRAIKPDNTGGYDFAVMDARGKIVAEAFEHVGLSDGSLASMRLPAGAYDARPVAANAALIAAAPDMFAALRNVQALIVEAAMTGFNCHSGTWAVRLYESQQDTSAALAKANPPPPPPSPGNEGGET